MENTIAVTRDGKFHVIQIHSLEELKERFFESRETVTQLEARIQEAEQEIATHQANVKNMQEGRMSLIEFLKNAGEVIDAHSKN